MNEAAAARIADPVRFALNQRAVALEFPRQGRLSDALRLGLGLTGTKVGCSAGDCGACTVLIDGMPVCACLVALGQVEGRRVTTVEGLASEPRFAGLRAAFQRCGAAQCGICTPGMLVSAAGLLLRRQHPGRAEIEAALGGVLCRCTGYAPIIAAVEAAAGPGAEPVPPPPRPGEAVGARIARLDGAAKIDGTERFGADGIPGDALWLRVVRSPHAHARFEVGPLAPMLVRQSGLVRILAAADVPVNRFGIYPEIKDQPVLAERLVRFRGEAVLALVGSREAVERIDDEAAPIRYQPLPALQSIEAALAPDAAEVQPGRTGNVLVEGRVRRGDVGAGFARAALVAEACVETAHVEHAYIEPEAGWARRVGERLELHVSTQTPYMDRDETARVMGLRPEQVRIVPTGCGGGFGGKLDLSAQPLIALAAWLTGRPVACVYTRPESMLATTKRHPARIAARLCCDAMGDLLAAEVEADFETGPYASWGPTVATRVPIHAMGPYRISAVASRARAVLTNGPNAGAFRGFGVPQAALAHEVLMDDLALAGDHDRLALRRRNALRAGDATATGQRLEAGVGLSACLDALAPRWAAELDEAARCNRAASASRRGVGIACGWYGIGNTGMPNPSTMRLALTRDGRVRFRNGAVDIGQGSTTVLTQIAADALGLPLASLDLVVADTEHTADAGKTSASRQTFVSGRAAHDAAARLRAAMLRLANAAPEAVLHLEPGALMIGAGAERHRIDLASLPTDGDEVLSAEARFDPPATPLDADGQGTPYAAYAFAAQIAVVEVDLALGTVRVPRMIAAHDVGRAINPLLIEGQITGGIAQGLGLALMEEYLAGRTDNLHDYLIPTVGDVPAVEVILIEDPAPLGPYGAKGVGEPALVPTAPAILSAIRHATGARLTRVPVLPHRLRAALRAAGHAP
jgi:CO/xanthine dehydrogenase Mo-binding subunit/aerobic-type carbon monoxide dehydrogenase small subunit (CoxS/CutS family)